MKKIYLAGPEVFLPNAREISDMKKDLCSDYGFEGVSPLDKDLSSDGKTRYQFGVYIYLGNVRLMDKCDMTIANMTPFHGPSCDIGTGYEMGYFRGKGLPVYAYSNLAEDIAQRQHDAYEYVPDDGPIYPYRETTYQTGLQDYGMSENLMLEGAVLDTNGNKVFLPKTTDDANRYTRLDVFEDLLKHMQTTID